MAERPFNMGKVPGLMPRFPKEKKNISATHGNILRVIFHNYNTRLAAKQSYYLPKARKNYGIFNN